MIRVRDVHKVFNSWEIPGRVALDGVSLSVSRGEWCSVLGHNGSGKSTLLRVIAGEAVADSGEVDVDGRPVGTLSAKAKANLLFFIEQEAKANLVPSMTIEENLFLAECDAWFPGLRFARRKDRERHLLQALARIGLGLEARLKTQVRHLSGGERQAVVLAKALVAETPVLLLDEFLAAMDPRAGPALLKTVREAAQKFGITVLSVTHNLDHVLDSCEPQDKVVVMRQGRIVADMRMADVDGAQQLIDLYEPSAQFGALKSATDKRKD